MHNVTINKYGTSFFFGGFFMEKAVVLGGRVEALISIRTCRVP